MSARRYMPTAIAAAALLLSLLACLSITAAARAQAGLQWRLVAPQPPGATTPCGGEGQPACAAPVQLGRVGDLEFQAPNRGLLITAGNGSSVPPGIWVYDGVAWRELANVCGAGDGRVAWAGPDEFWTVSDGRPGQPANGQGLLPPLEDNTLCHFAPVREPDGKIALGVTGSYASVAFQAGSYQAMHAAACASTADCWFAGEPLPAPQPGSFHLHWNGAALESDPNPLAHRVVSIQPIEGGLVESAELPLSEAQGTNEEPIEILHPFTLWGIGAEAGGAAFSGLRPFSSARAALPEYAPNAFPSALEGLLLSTAAGAGAEGEATWAAAGAQPTAPAGSAPAALTVLRRAGGAWTQVLGPAGTESLAVTPEALAEQTVESVAAEPGGAGAWLALTTPLQAIRPSPTALATVVHVAADGSLSEEQLPTAAERAAGVAPQGPALRVSCPAANDCWLVTARGSLFHLSTESGQTHAPDTDALLKGPLVTYRPPDAGIPAGQVATEGGSGEEAQALFASLHGAEHAPATAVFRVSVPPYSNARGRLLKGSVLELSFRLPVSSRVRLLARRRARLVGGTPARVLAAGRRAVRLRLDPHNWPTKLDLQVHPLRPLPTVPASGAVNALATALRPAGAAAAHLITGLGF